MAFTKKPSDPPAFNAAAFTKALVAGTPLNATVAAQYVAWKKWVESTDTFDGADKGGLRDVLDADMKAVDALKGDVDAHTDRLNTQNTRIAALEAQPPQVPFGA